MTEIDASSGRQRMLVQVESAFDMMMAFAEAGILRLRLQNKEGLCGISTKY